MYKLIFTLFLSIISIQTFAQYTPADSANGIKVNPEFMEQLKQEQELNAKRIEDINRAGLFLEKSGGQSLGAIVCLITGGLIAGLTSVANDDGNASQNNVNPGAIVGIGIGAVGFGLAIGSHINKKKAGAILRRVE